MVFDVYREESIKNAERQLRTKEPGVEFKHIASGHIVKQWRAFLSSSINKMNLIIFLVEEGKKPMYRKKLGYVTLYVTCKESCDCITKEIIQEVPELQSTHEEADIPECCSTQPMPQRDIRQLLSMQMTLMC